MHLTKAAITLSVGQEVTYKLNAVFVTKDSLWIEMRMQNRPIWDKILRIVPQTGIWKVQL